MYVHKCIIIFNIKGTLWVVRLLAICVSFNLSFSMLKF